MLNYYRWTTAAQIVFMAPTKPLIAQQMEACYGIVGIPKQDTVLMTGETTPAVRSDEWLDKRVFFMTPQTVINDLKTGICDPKKLILLVVDEAHKATGGYAYTEVIAFMQRFNSSFRVLALTATPGSTVEAVQAVIDNLGIARVELRTERSLDIRQYTHEKHTETEAFDFSPQQGRIMELFAKALQTSVDKLSSQNAYWSKDPMKLTAYGLTTARQKWMQSDTGRKAPQPVKGMMNAIFTVLSSLAHSIGLLKFHGIGPFYSGVIAFQQEVESGQTKSKTATGIAHSDHFRTMMSTIRTWTNDPNFVGHPKLEYVREVVLNHFLDAGEGMQGSDVPPSATRVMIFASYRDSVEEIVRVLKRNEPMIRPHVFVGQAASKGSEGMDQKKQNAVIQDFKSGKYNTLVATSIGEEGLDIGTVDLIVCYDASSSPIRMLQRIGRTGRKRVGRVVLLLMKEKEESDYAKAQDNYAYIQKSIADASKYAYRDDQSPRILPREIKPVCDKRPVEIPIENSQPVDLNERGRKAKGGRRAKRPLKKFHMPDNVRTGFVTASKLDSDSDQPGKGFGPKKTVVRKKSIPAKKRTPSPSPEPETAPLPSLPNVFLDNEQMQELQDKYAQSAAVDGDVVVGPPNALRFPAKYGNLGPTTHIRHGRAAQTVERAMQAIHGVDAETVSRMEAALHMSDLEDTGPASVRLVSPEVRKPAVARMAPAGPTGLASTGPVAVLVSGPKPRGRPKKAPPPPSKLVDSESEPELPCPPPPAPRPVQTTKPRERTRKKQPLQRAVSYGSAAGEGVESSPEPTPADMRIGTQGFDLGSRDTSGEDEEEEPDSDDLAFMAHTSDPIELASSSQRTSPTMQKPRGLKKKPNHLRTAEDLSDSEEVDGSDEKFAKHPDDDQPVPRLGRRKRVVADSDSDEG
ncbi:hypothetical protein DOTSEDRAFT_75812 [Dothistroma septosporum NZE10]|uniref:ATP-dependent DNA helicase n=1 Tax=Dothistroma septosporum (strain NZE10 / CBS 128990) TaxID=675120 RepID=N1PC78_DOTSN|nr:hypothetical protein DOTSEDRAFT_75812 [Dothistroma septosporum NZE10]